MNHQADIEPVVTMLVLLVPLVAGLVALAVSVLMIVAFWKICVKAGFSGALGLLMLIPIGNIILPLYLAFAQWPSLKDKQML